MGYPEMSHLEWQNKIIDQIAENTTQLRVEMYKTAFFKFIKFVVEVTFSFLYITIKKKKNKRKLHSNKKNAVTGLHSTPCTNLCYAWASFVMTKKHCAVHTHKYYWYTVYYIIYRRKRDIFFEIINVRVVKNSEHSPQFRFWPHFNFFGNVLILVVTPQSGFQSSVKSNHAITLIWFYTM